MVLLPLQQLKGLDSLRKYLLQQAPHFRASPILLVTSNIGEDDRRKKRKESMVVTSTTCRRVQFLLQQQLGLRCITVEQQQQQPPHQHSYPYPTLAQVQQTQELACRVLAGSVVGVGSGAALDLAKAVSSRMDQQQQQEQQQQRSLVLIPATYTGIMVSASGHSLLLDPQEATLVASKNNDGDGCGDGEQSAATTSSSRVVVQLEPNQMCPENLETTILAAVALLLDHIRILHNNNTSTKASGGGGDLLLEEAKSLLDNLLLCAYNKLTTTTAATVSNNNGIKSEKDIDTLLWQTLLRVGSSDILRFGDSSIHSPPHYEQLRSVPLALAASLSPTVPYSVASLMASTASYLLNELQQVLQERADVDSERSESKNSSSLLLLRQLIDMCESQSSSGSSITLEESLDAVLAHIRANRALNRCRDDETALRNLVRTSMVDIQ